MVVRSEEEHQLAVAAWPVPVALPLDLAGTEGPPLSPSCCFSFSAMARAALVPRGLRVVVPPRDPGPPPPPPRPVLVSPLVCPLAAAAAPPRPPREPGPPPRPRPRPRLMLPLGL